MKQVLLSEGHVSPIISHESSSDRKSQVARRRFRGGAAAALGRPVLLRDSGTEPSINGGEGKLGRRKL